ncbi:hypothetical protein [Oxynema aestuarii]|uniref:Uncharacterized protein n=1 Tax=Oxynema aestuarii AP17 TaxID=2064643 RepID=A0A6H1TSA5_9CYAN|nr:hypothetical protein [Oxynema aestuarii]QIZ69488.1 hypothetical protein HCG48_01880 [Oxynema aestuarii AP17]RMH73893.1 MAG: hypothetical protein D6680_15880 [Cyanobacteria bacterium J007]
MMNCPCCSNSLLAHIGSSGLYWYCCNCRQAMPALSEYRRSHHRISSRFSREQEDCLDSSNLEN